MPKICNNPMVKVCVSGFLEVLSDLRVFFGFLSHMYSLSLLNKGQSTFFLKFAIYKIPRGIRLLDVGL